MKKNDLNTAIDKIIKRLKKLNLYNPIYTENSWKYHNLNPKDFLI